MVPPLIWGISLDLGHESQRREVLFVIFRIMAIFDEKIGGGPRFLLQECWGDLALAVIK